MINHPALRAPLQGGEFVKLRKGTYEKENFWTEIYVDSNEKASFFLLHTPDGGCSFLVADIDYLHRYY